MEMYIHTQSNVHTEYEINGNERIHTQPIRRMAWSWCLFRLYCSIIIGSCGGVGVCVQICQWVVSNTFVLAHLNCLKSFVAKLSKLCAIPTGCQEFVDMFFVACDSLNLITFRIYFDAFFHFRFLFQSFA